MRACSGRQPIMQTIMAGKMEMVLPAMYMMNRFMGICFSGARATSQHATLRGRHVWCTSTCVARRSRHLGCPARTARKPCLCVQPCRCQEPAGTRTPIPRRAPVCAPLGRTCRH
uniref:Uncharacterized protein n=1 Tax=Zosterops lateralis melanops TaxID=1220523 RepID=A0A8D2PPM7_ZOSLA